MEYRVVNHDTEEMFYHIGAHPGFMLPVSSGETLADCELVFEKAEDFVSYEYDLENMEFNTEKKVVQKQRATHYHLLLQCLTVMLFSLNTPIPIVFPSLTLILEKV